MNRRTFLKTSGASALLAAAGPEVIPGSSWAQAQERPLSVLPVTDLTGGIEDRIALALKSSNHDFGNGRRSPTYGINATYLGPVIRAKRGQTLPFDVINGIEDVTTLHWHGLHIPGDVDGGPHQEIEPGQTWSPDVPITQQASMNWFHSHTHGRTAQQTYKGLAGVLLIEDEDSLTADLPKTYGIDDFTLVLQDKMFSTAGEMSYTVSGEVFEEGFIGDTLVVNGTLAPVARSVPTGLVRLRLLNACNAQFLTLSLDKGPLTIIASDGGFLASAVETDTILMAPGERYEVLVDLRTVEQNSLMVGFESEGILSTLSQLFGRRKAQWTALTLRRTGEKGFDGATPERLANLPAVDPSQAVRTRSFELQMATGVDLAALALAWGNVCGGGAMAINGQPMRMDRIDETVRKGYTEIWRIAVDEQLHPFHIHGCSFRILSQHGKAPPAYASGWKDMVHVEDGWSEVLVQFNHLAPEDAPYMYHCHILEHEDCGMMGQFTVT